MTEATTSAHPADVLVAVYDNVSGDLVTSTQTDSQGDYSFSSPTLPAGTYRIMFDAGQWWSGATSFDSATPVAVDGTTPVVINPSITLDNTGLSGTAHLADANGNASPTPLAGAKVDALFAGDDSVAATTTTASDGTYSLPNLPGGNVYRVRFSHTGSGTSYAVHPDSPPYGTQKWTVGATGVDGALGPEASISGVVASGSSPLGGILVNVEDQSTGLFNPVPTKTDSTGHFSVGALAPGTYKIGFIDPTGALGNRVYGTSTFDVGAGTSVTTTAGATTDIGTEYLAGPDCDPSVYKPGADFTGADLSGRKLSGCDLSGISFTNTDLANADLSGANFSGSILPGANLTGADLSNASNVNSSLVAATLTGANLANIGDTLYGSDLSGKDLTGTNFTGDNLSYVNLNTATVTGAKFTTTDLTGTTMTNLIGINSALDANLQPSSGLFTATLNGTDFTGSGLDLSGANAHGLSFAGINFTGTNFDGTNLVGADFTGTNPTGANFTDANLTNATGLTSSWSAATLTGANLTNIGDALYGSDLSGKDLTGTNFTGDNLSYVNLNTATVTGAKFTTTDLTGTTMTNLIGINSALDANLQPSSGLFTATLNGTDFTGSGLDLSGANAYGLSFASVNFTGTTFNSTNLVGADFTGTNLTGADLTNADLTSATNLDATLATAILTGTNLTHIGDALYGTDLSGKNLIFTNFTSDNLSYVNLSDATLQDATLDGTNLTGATLDRVQSGNIAGIPAALPTDWQLIAGTLQFVPIITDA